MGKCTIMSGDCSALELAMSEADRQTVIEEVSLIYHCAATIRFDETLKKAVLLNTRGTKCMLDLAAQMKKLDVSFKPPQFGRRRTMYKISKMGFDPMIINCCVK